VKIDVFQALEQRVEFLVLARSQLLGFDSVELLGELLFLGRSQRDVPSARHGFSQPDSRPCLLPS
jgi:hypothetical protein